jgi:hypothetical protein
MTTISEYVDEIQAAKKAEWKRLGYTFAPAPTYSFTTGKRFFKITEKSNGSNSVHCFVEIETGDIYKAAGFSAPAKGIRGNINDDKKPLLCGDFYR